MKLDDTRSYKKNGFKEAKLGPKRIKSPIGKSIKRKTMPKLSRILIMWQNRPLKDIRNYKTNMQSIDRVLRKKWTN
jgi:hypothetical protein